MVTMTPSTRQDLRRLGRTLGTLQPVTIPAKARRVRPPADPLEGRRMYSQLADLVRAYVDSLRGRACYRTRKHTASEWILTLTATPTRKEVMARHTAKGTGDFQPGSGQANMELGLLRAACRWGLYHDCWEGVDPTAGIRKWKRPLRKRTGKFEELRTIMKFFDRETLDPDDEMTHEEFIRWRALFGLMLFTGCRPSEARRAKVDAITTYGVMGAWIKGMTKTGEPQELPLPTQLMDWLAAWYAIRRTDRPNPYLFPGQEYAQPISSELVRLRWSELRTRVGITGLWNYDLRRTLATSMSNELGYDDSTIRAILNHHDTSALSHYRHKTFDSLTKPIQAYADWLWGLKGTSCHLPQERRSSCSTVTLGRAELTSSQEVACD